MSKGKRRSSPGPQAKGAPWKPMHGKRSSPKGEAPKDTHVMPTCLCPACGSMISRAGAQDRKKSRAPVSGDWSVCMSCAVVVRYTDDLKLRLPTRGEFEALREADPEAVEELKLGSAAVVAMRREVGPSKAPRGGFA